MVRTPKGATRPNALAVLSLMISSEFGGSLQRSPVKLLRAQGGGAHRTERHLGPLAHMMPLSAVWAGPQRNEHLNGPPLLFAKTEGATPFRLSLHVGDVGHTLVVGPTGAGKSVLLALLALQFRRYPGAQIFAFDFGCSVRAATIAMGGDWHDIGGVLSGDSTEFVELQPLATIDDPSERGWAAEWIAGILGRERVEVTPEAKDHLWSALTSLASAPIQERTLTGLCV